MELARAWTAFGGASLALMGAALGAGSRRLSAENLAWRREWRHAVGVSEADDAEAASLALLYRGAGALIGAAGLAVLSAVGAGQAFVPGPSSPRLVGVLIALVGLGAGALKALARPSAPRHLPRELGAGAAPSFEDRACDASIWALCALWAAFGIFLSRGAFS
jgi:hypothetical protein